MKKCAICLMTRNIYHLPFWIEYHLDQYKFDYILVRFESHEVFPFKDKRILIIQHMMPENTRNSILTQQYRQVDFVNYCIQHICPIYDIRYLLHIDDDELFWLNPSFQSIHDFLKKTPHDDPVDSLRFQNVEAILNTSNTKNKNIFQSTHLFLDCSLEKCRSYSNGKSMAIIKNVFSTCTGCHTFHGVTKNISKELALILHFDSIRFQDWKKKFHHLSNISPTLYKKIPFEFYKKSILAQKNSEKDQYEFWFDQVRYRGQKHVMTI